jgi:uncharacterized protein (UPF0335 family)
METKMPIPRYDEEALRYFTDRIARRMAKKLDFYAKHNAEIAKVFAEAEAFGIDPVILQCHVHARVQEQKLDVLKAFADRWIARNTGRPKSWGYLK